MGEQAHASQGRQGPVAELHRLEMQELMLDPFTAMLLDGIGVGQGWRCLEVGVGAGSVTRWLSERVGPTGRVVGVDLDDRFFDLSEADNVELMTGDIRSMPLADGSLDLIHTRMLLIYLPDVGEVLKRLRRALRPGGWLLAEEADLSYAHRYAGETLEPWERFVASSVRAMRAVGADFTLGSKLPELLASAGFVDIQAEGHFPFLLPGTVAARHLTESIKFSRPFLVANGEYDDAGVDELEALVADGSVRTGYTLISAWGRAAVS